MKKFSLLLLLLLFPLLPGCVPGVRVPPVSPAEIEAETAYQVNYVRNARAKGLVHGVYKRGPVGPRLQSVASRIAPAAIQLCKELHASDPVGCAFDIHITRSTSDGEDVVNAWADGKTVFITPAMVHTTQNDDELASVLAHEFSHNIMGHIEGGNFDRLAGAALGAVLDASVQGEKYRGKGDYQDTGALSATLIFSPGFESEADYFGFYLMARAGYRYHLVPEFWRRFSLENPDSVFWGVDHPSNPERYVTMRKIAEEIDEKKRLGHPLLPNMGNRHETH